VLYNFGVDASDPLHPQYDGFVAQGRDGSLYSTTPNGGTYGYGSVFKITQAGKLTVLYSFDVTDHGSEPQIPCGGLTLGIDGNLYGTTASPFL
jgi:uncharacterized repeat protein (TIGR03803 family)